MTVSAGAQITRQCQRYTDAAQVCQPWLREATNRSHPVRCLPRRLGHPSVIGTRTILLARHLYLVLGISVAVTVVLVFRAKYTALGFDLQQNNMYTERLYLSLSLSFILTIFLDNYHLF